MKLLITQTEDSAFFVLTNTLNIVTITLQSDVTEELIAPYTQFLTFNVIASHPETTSGNTSVLIRMPEKICPGIFEGTYSGCGKFNNFF